VKNILRINGFVEGISGFLLIFSPQWLLQNPEPEIYSLSVGKLYGMLALVFGIISFVLAGEYTDNQMFKRVILAIISFHFAVAMYMYGLFQQQITPNPGAFVLHLILAVVFLGIYLKNLQKENS
jgi:hypothetical protein